MFLEFGVIAPQKAALEGQLTGNIVSRAISNTTTQQQYQA